MMPLLRVLYNDSTPPPPRVNVVMRHREGWYRAEVHPLVQCLHMNIPENFEKIKIGWFVFSCSEDNTIMFTELMNDHWQEWKQLFDFRHVKVLKKNNIYDAFDVAFVEGAIASPEHEEKLKDIRKRSTKLVAVGACAVTGLPASQRNTFTPEQKEAIQFLVDRFGALPEVKKVSDVVAVDASVPGCPMNTDMFLKAVNALVVELRPELAIPSNLQPITYNLIHMHKVDIDLEHVTKIEGDASIRITVEDGKATKVNFSTEEYKRFFTEALKGKSILAVPSHLSRICGTCSNAHIMAAIEACEMALDIQPSQSRPSVSAHSRCTVLPFVTMHSTSTSLHSLIYMERMHFSTLMKMTHTSTSSCTTGLISSVPAINSRSR